MSEAGATPGGASPGGRWLSDPPLLPNLPTRMLPAWASVALSTCGGLLQLAAQPNGSFQATLPVGKLGTKGWCWSRLESPSTCVMGDKTGKARGLWLHGSFKEPEEQPQ